MTDDSQRQSTDVLGALPSSRPHRRSAKRPASPAETAPPETAAKAASPVKATPRSPAKAAPSGADQPRRVRAARTATPSAKRRLRQPPQPRGLPPTPEKRERPEPEESHDLVSGTIRAAADLTEISISASARMLRAAVSWLPRR